MRGQHPTVEEVYEEVVKLIPPISLATVYRILSQYAEQGLIGRVHAPDSAVRYDDLMDPHHHLRCTACGRVLDLPPLGLPEISLPQDALFGHTITGVELMFRGVCAECQAKES